MAERHPDPVRDAELEEESANIQTPTKISDEEKRSDPDPETAPEDYVSDMSPVPSDNWNCKTWVENWLWYGQYVQFCVVSQTTQKCEWIEDLLKSNIFSKFRKVEETCKFEIHGDINYKNKLSSCSCVIFCFENAAWNPKLLEDVKLLSSFYAMRNVIVLLGGGKADPGLFEQKMTMRTWYKEQNCDCSFEILPLTDNDITWCRKHLMSYEKKMEGIRQLLEGGIRYLVSCYKSAVGIFSRSSESDYKWLINWLTSASFMNLGDVRPCYISNNGSRRFREDVSQCRFGILYHTKNRGRINITDVTDSLYDAELQYMSEILGRSNVIVVVDDLIESSDGEKDRILETQPSIKEKAADIFLFTTDERTYLEKLVTIKKFIKGGSTSQD
ncbi:uncharacterized protein LOC134945685 [Pseudophryne corroboree]|uniref:uncharacterized protein LOC134945685 n=1 Tax=Pseudophryne corroboree TaxID=495146 RepID=UPI00308196D7